MSDITPYLSLITSEHNNKPNFMAVVAALIQPLSDTNALISTMPGLFDIDVAVGQQLDYVGQWIGKTRALEIPITGVFFSLDTTGVGLDQGILWTPFTPADGLELLPDGQYRVVLKMRILNNQWNGSLQNAYAILDTTFNGASYYPLIQDNSDMTMAIGLAGSVDTITQALLVQGFLDIRPAGVFASYLVPSVSGPFFGLDIENNYVSGLDVGSWATDAPYSQIQSGLLGSTFILGTSQLG